MQLLMQPVGWPCSLDNCPPGFFVWHYFPGEEGKGPSIAALLGFKSDYNEFYNEGGEKLNIAGIDRVQPVRPGWEEL